VTAAKRKVLPHQQQQQQQQQQHPLTCSRIQAGRIDLVPYVPVCTLAAASRVDTSSAV
jgi:hypothetical protein